MSPSLALANALLYGFIAYMLYRLVEARRRYHGQPPLRLAGRLTDLVAHVGRRLVTTSGERYALWLAKRRLPYVRTKLVEQAKTAHAHGHFLGPAVCRRIAPGRWAWRVHCLAPHCGQELVIYETVSLDASGVRRRFDAEGALYANQGPCTDRPL